MSGGHFDYQQYQLGYMADSIEQLIRDNNNSECNEWGDTIGNFYPEDVIDKFKETMNMLHLVQAMVQRIDWLVSADDGVESFRERWEETVEKLRNIENRRINNV